MTVEQRKIQLINSITSLENEALLIRMEELIEQANSDVPPAIMRLLEKSSKSNKRIPHTSVRDLIRKQMKITWYELALESLEQVLDFIEDQWGSEITEEFIQLIDNRISQLINNPKIAPSIKNTKFRKLIIHKHITIFYEVIETELSIILVWDNRQNPNELEQMLAKE